MTMRRTDSAAAEYALAHTGALRVSGSPVRWPLRVMLVGAGRLLEGGTERDLLDRGIEVSAYPDPASALINLLMEEPSIVVVSTRIEGVPFEIFVAAISATTGIPVVVGLENDSAAGELAFAGLEAGARSILQLPFTPEQLSGTARLLGFSGAVPAAALTAGDVCLDPQAHRLLIGGVDVAVTPREFELMKYLLSNHPRVVTPEELARASAVYEDSTVSATRVHVSRLRKKVDAARTDGVPVLETVRGFGYRLNAG